MTPRALSEGEEALNQDLDLLVKAHKVPPFEREFTFFGGRKWRSDFAFPEQKLLIEVEGGSWIGGRHNRGTGYQEDLRKYNTASIEGWTVFRFTTEMVKQGEAISWIIDFFEREVARNEAVIANGDVGLDGFG